MLALAAALSCLFASRGDGVRLDRQHRSLARCSAARSGCGGARLEALAQAKLRRAAAPPCSRALSSAAQGDVRRYASAAPPRLPRLWCFTQGELLASGRGAATSQPLCPLVTTQPSLSLISTQWYAFCSPQIGRLRSSLWRRDGCGLQTRRRGDVCHRRGALQDHSAHPWSNSQNSCGFRDTCPQHSPSTLHITVDFTYTAKGTLSHARASARRTPAAFTLIHRA